MSLKSEEQMQLQYGYIVIDEFKLRQMTVLSDRQTEIICLHDSCKIMIEQVRNEACAPASRQFSYEIIVNRSLV